MSISPVVSDAQLSPAHRWFAEHQAELRSRAQRFARRFPRGRRQDAVAEILGQIWRYLLCAISRGKLAMLTPFTLVSFFGRSYAAGRRLCGTRTNDVLCGRRHHPWVIPLDEPRAVHTSEGFTRLPLSEVLADRRVVSPLELARQNLDYPAILRRQHATRRARQVFAWLAHTQGTGQQTELARELGVSPPRIVQLKKQLARCLAAEDYAPTGYQPMLSTCDAGGAA